MSSAPASPKTSSTSSPALRLSLAALPCMVSVPVLPHMVSPPPFPFMVSFPPSPDITSADPPPFMVLLLLLPLWLASSETTTTPWQTRCVPQAGTATNRTTESTIADTRTDRFVTGLPPSNGKPPSARTDCSYSDVAVSGTTVSATVSPDLPQTKSVPPAYTIDGARLSTTTSSAGVVSSGVVASVSLPTIVAAFPAHVASSCAPEVALAIVSAPNTVTATTTPAIAARFIRSSLLPFCLSGSPIAPELVCAERRE